MPRRSGVYFFVLLLDGDLLFVILVTSTLLALIMILANSYIYIQQAVRVTSRTFHVAVSKIVSILLFIIPTSVGIVHKCSIPEKANFLEGIIRPEFYFNVCRDLFDFQNVSRNNLEELSWDVLVPALGLLFGYNFVKIFVLPVLVCKIVAIESGIPVSQLCHYSILFHSPRPTQLLWLLLQWPCILDVKCY